MPQVEFEFSPWVLPKAIPAVANPGFVCLFMYANELPEKKSLLNSHWWWWPLPIAIPAVAATANHCSSGGPELKLRW